MHNRDKEGFTACYQQLVLKDESSKVSTVRSDRIGVVMGRLFPFLYFSLPFFLNIFTNETKFHVNFK